MTVNVEEEEELDAMTALKQHLAQQNLTTQFSSFVLGCAIPNGGIWASTEAYGV